MLIIDRAMRVLFFAWSPLSPKAPAHGYGGGGWLGTLQKELKAHGVELGYTYIATEDDWFQHGGYSYYSIKRENKTLKEKILVGMNPRNCRFEKARDERYMRKFQKVVEDFKPDIIHVFGSEQCYGLITKYTSIPVLIHLQGILNVYRNAYLVPGVSLATYCLQNYNPKQIWGRYQRYWEWYRVCKREREILSSCRYFIGRTDWDRGCLSVLTNSSCEYYYGGEMLRDAFHSAPERRQPERLTIVTTSSAAVYKGYDMILKTAKILQEKIGDNFTWKVYGNVEPVFFEKHLGIKHEDVNVELCGVATAEQLAVAFSQCTLYFHPSYIENSPNSLCEAQLCGCPVVACFIGGNDTLVNHGEEGFLVPANDPYMAASRVMQLYKEKELNHRMGKNGKATAQKRHDRTIIAEGLIKIFNQILERERR